MMALYDEGSYLKQLDLGLSPGDKNWELLCFWNQCGINKIMHLWNMNLGLKWKRERCDWQLWIEEKMSGHYKKIDHEKLRFWGGSRHFGAWQAQVWGHLKLKVVNPSILCSDFGLSPNKNMDSDNSAKPGLIFNDDTFWIPTFWPRQLWCV